MPVLKALAQSNAMSSDKSNQRTYLLQIYRFNQELKDIGSSKTASLASANNESCCTKKACNVTVFFLKGNDERPE